MEVRRKRLLSIIVIFLVIGFIAGYVYYTRIYKSYPSKMPQYTKVNTKSDVLVKEMAKSEGKLMFETLYTGNGEIIKEEQKIGPSLYGKSRDEIAKIYSGWDIKEFDSDKIVLYKERSGLPPDYYIISNSDGYVTLYKSDGNGGKSLIEKTDISINNLNPNDKERILKNIVIKDIDEAYSILTNLSS